MLETVELDGSRPATHAEIEARAATPGAPAARLIACGHTHVPRLVQTASGCTIVNPGSVGLPAYEDDHPMAPPEQPAVYYVETGSPHASYAIVEDVGTGWDASFHRVRYDWESAAVCAARNGRPEWAHALRTGFALRA
jgi:hypothetical protein